MLQTSFSFFKKNILRTKNFSLILNSKTNLFNMDKTKNATEKMIDKTIGRFVVENTQMSVNDFISLKTVHNQRWEEPRFTKLLKILEKELLPEHICVEVVRVHFTDSYYTSGNYYSINGNTRKLLWRDNPNVRPNFPLNVRITNAYSISDVEKSYRAYDSQDSVEKNEMLIQGRFRAYDNYRPKTKKFSDGKILSPLKWAAAGLFGFDTSRWVDQDLAFNEFVDDVIYLDNQNITNKKYNTSLILSALLMILKKHGRYNEKVQEGIYNLLNDKVTHTENGYDGINFISWKLYEKYNPSGLWAKPSAGNAPHVIGQILFAFESFLDEIPVVKVLSHKKAVDYYNNFWGELRGSLNS
ncbi:MAG: hypothetical protein RLZ10_1411 [Bacteroidota bacterium]|jgi:hypothetical protein